MSHNDASESKRIKLTQEEDSKRETPIDNGHSVANSKGMLLEQNITNFCLYITILVSIIDIGLQLIFRYSFFQLKAKNIS